ncbi:hypothetical protein N0M98_33505 [Paenibacillus doosanensis]|nr:hypothetical protein [Paenibacillus doosanensis]MCS7465002.1 hypothetical protein [Paenibacillus doosanensis]
MKKSNTILPILQTVLTPEEAESIVKAIGYVDKAHYWVAAANEEWSGYRFGADHAACNGLSQVRYSCFSGKAADVPFAVFKELFHLLVRKCNRETRRKLAFPKELLLIDSTTMTVGKTRLPWAPYHGERAAVKLHVALRAQNGQPLRVTETIGARHDGPDANPWKTPTLLWSWTGLTANWSAWTAINKMDNPLSSGFVTMFILKTLCTSASSHYRFSGHSGYHLPVGNPSVSF